MSYVIQELCDEIEKLKQALAEKDREAQQIREHEFQNGYREAEAMWEEKYQQLMAQAVQFAAYIQDEFTYDDDPRFVEAQAFLKESP